MLPFILARDQPKSAKNRKHALELTSVLDPRTKSNYRKFSGNIIFDHIYVQTEQNRYESVYFCMLIPIDPI